MARDVRRVVITRCTIVQHINVMIVVVRGNTMLERGYVNVKTHYGIMMVVNVLNVSIPNILILLTIPVRNAKSKIKSMISNIRNVFIVRKNIHTSMAPNVMYVLIILYGMRVRSCVRLVRVGKCWFRIVANVRREPTGMAPNV